MTNRSGTYGRFGNVNVHRVAYESLRGPIPKGLTIDHLCRNTICINPDHLEAVALTENIRRGFSPTAINRRKTKCPKGHEYTPRTLHGKMDGRECKPCNTERSLRWRLKQPVGYWRKYQNAEFEKESKNNPEADMFWNRKCSR